MSATSGHSPRITTAAYINRVRKKVPHPWWHHLDSGFHRYPDHFRLNTREKLVIGTTAAFDIAVRTMVASAVASLALPLSVWPTRLKRDLDTRHIYERAAHSGDPEQFFDTPTEIVDVQRDAASWFSFHPDDGQSWVLSFQSPYRPKNNALRDAYLANQQNQRAMAQFWKHNGEPRPTLCVIHGFMADPYWINSLFLALPWFYKQGYNILLMTLPFHGARKGRYAPFSGHGLFAGGMAHLNEAFGQAVYDFRLFLNYLEQEENISRFGITGISLGGYASALLASIEPRLLFAIPNVPVVSLADLVMDWFPASWLVKGALKASDSSMREFRQLLAVHCPLTYPSLLPAERLMIIGGAGDRFSPPKQTSLLWEHWNRCELHWFPGNHLLHLDKGLYLRQMKDFMQRIDFVGHRKNNLRRFS